ncbi:MAG TPA: hypothetical protein VGC39_05390 [Candidatus Methylacidiphilales bacterium]
MKISRKLQRQVENKIRHAMATGKLHSFERSSAGESDPKLGFDKADGNGAGPSK